jgi:hypothetical protein
MFFTNKNNSGAQQNYVTIQYHLHAGRSKLKNASELDNPANTFLNVTNQDEDNQGYYSVTAM